MKKFDTDKKMKSSYSFFSNVSLILSCAFFYALASQIYNTEYDFTKNLNQYFELDLPVFLLSLAGLGGLVVGYGYDKLKIYVGAFRNKCLQDGNKKGARLFSFIGAGLVAVSVGATTYTGYQISQSLNSGIEKRNNIDNENKSSNQSIDRLSSTNKELKLQLDEKRNLKDEVDENNSYSVATKIWKKGEIDKEIKVLNDKVETNNNKIEELINKIALSNRQKEKIKDNSNNPFLYKINLYFFTTELIVLIAFFMALTIEIIIFTLSDAITFEQVQNPSIEHQKNDTTKSCSIADTASVNKVQQASSEHLKTRLKSPSVNTKKSAKKGNLKQPLNYDELIKKVIESNIKITSRAIHNLLKVSLGSSDKIKKMIESNYHIDDETKLMMKPN